MRTSFYRHIKAMETELMNMGQAVEKAIVLSIQALKQRDLELAKKIVKDDEIINAQRWRMEEECVNIIALQQPVASDLREMISILNIITDLERIGDYAEGVAKIVLLLGKEEPVKGWTDIPTMAEIATEMLSKSLKAFVSRDANAAEIICKMDDKVDELHDKVYHDLLNRMIEDPQVVTRATYQIWAAHNVERMADRVTNICERIIYLVKGAMPKNVDVSRY